MLFLEYPRCSTCRRAKAWLDDHKIVYTDRHIVDDNPSQDELRTWWQLSGLPLRRFFNTSGVVYKELGLKDTLGTMSDEEQLALLATNGKLVKRPIVIVNGKEGNVERVLVGFRADDWEQALSERS